MMPGIFDGTEASLEKGRNLVIKLSIALALGYKKESYDEKMCFFKYPHSGNKFQAA